MNTRVYLLGALCTAVIGLGVVSSPVPAWAKVAGQCSVCHTMHDSQGGDPMAVGGPNETLLIDGCVGCHTGTNTAGGTVPYVNSTVDPNYGADGTQGDTLAGGNFYWVAGGAAVDPDAKGHNVGTDSLAGLDNNFTNPLLPPGGTGELASQLTCAGSTGCHGNRAINSDFGAMSGTHHSNEPTTDGSTLFSSYRFLNGVAGIEDSDWEYRPTAAAHNQYKGVDRTVETQVDATTISSLCAQCHNDFHNGGGNVSATFTSPWVRHPTDFDMGNTAGGSEYRDYGGALVNAYVVAVPVASDDPLTGGVLSTVTFNNDTIVTCISCHRAHGTPYNDLLRWDYERMVVGSGNTDGCFECHTTKN